MSVRSLGARNNRGSVVMVEIFSKQVNAQSFAEVNRNKSTGTTARVYQRDVRAESTTYALWVVVVRCKDGAS